MGCKSEILAMLVDKYREYDNVLKRLETSDRKDKEELKVIMRNRADGIKQAIEMIDLLPCSDPQPAERVAIQY